MSTAEEELLQQKLQALRAHHAEVERQEISAIEMINEELTHMQEMAETLEKEACELEHRFGSGSDSTGQEAASGVLTLLGNIVLGLVDADDAKCKRR